MSSSDTAMGPIRTPRSNLATPRSGDSIPDSQPLGASEGIFPRTPRSVPSTPRSGISRARPELGSGSYSRFGRSSPMGTPDSRMTRPTSARATSSPSSRRFRGDDTDIPTDQEFSVWGTNINVQETMDAFGQFLMEYRRPEEASASDGDADSEPHYLRQLQDIAKSEVYTLNIDCAALQAFAATKPLYAQLVRYPAEMIPIMDMVVMEKFRQTYPLQFQAMQGARIQVRLFNLKDVHRMRDLDPEDIDQLVAIRGMVTRSGNIVPEMRQAMFRCRYCRNQVEVEVDRGHIAEPAVCTSCQEPHSFEVVHNLSVFDDMQLVKMQETPESIPEGETPHTVTLMCHSQLVDVARPGDRVEITGVFRATGQRVSSRKRTMRAVYNTYIDVLHICKTDKNRMSAEDPGADASSEFATPFLGTSDTEANIARRQAMFESMAADPSLYDKLAQSLAPSIWEMEDVKKGLLCQLFGGTNKDLGKHGKFRGEINVLLCGDPGTSKSQLLSYVNKISPRGIYTSGKGSSAVGLTAYITKDPDTKELILESGALVLSDRGICCIDEFDKMNDSTRSILHEVMEQQTVSIAKAGIICTLNARTAVLASANPVESRYNPTRSVVDNIQLPPTLLSRFDLIYLVLDKPDKDTDRRLAKHIVALYSQTHRADRALVPLKVLTEYISYARANVHPKISDAAAKTLVEGYKAMRSLGRVAGGSGKKVITATPRQLESLIRLSEGLARMHLKSTVEKEDVEEAIRLMNVATQTAATDPRTGAIDMDMIATGRTAAEHEDLNDLIEAVRNVFTAPKGRKISLANLTRQLQQNTEVTMRDDAVQFALEQMENEGMVRLDGRNIVKLQAW